MGELKPFIFQDDMLFESQFVRVRVGAKTKSYYEELLGETLSVGQEIDAPVGWLSRKSGETISVVCTRCGKVRKIKFYNLMKYNHSFCNACSKHRKLDWMLGKVFGRLTVICFGSGILETNGRTSSTFICKCECGNEVEVRTNSLRRGEVISCDCYRKERISETNSGENNHLYNPNLSYEERIARRNVPENNRWRKAVYERDNYTCKACSKAGGHLVAHHIVPYSTNKQLRFDVDNGITLCKTCHKEFHVNFMGGYKVKCNSSDLFTFIVLKKKSNP